MKINHNSQYGRKRNRAFPVFLAATAALAISGHAAISLGTAVDFAVLGQSTVTTTGATVNGNLGLSPGTSITGGPTVTGLIYTGASPVSAAALTDARSAFNQISALTGGINVTGDLGVGAFQTLSPGIYDFSSSAQLTGALNLSGPGEFVFRIVSTLTTATGSSIVLSNGATPDHVYFQVGSSTTLGTATNFSGTIISDVSSTLNGSTVNGRVIALGGAVVLNGSSVTVPEPSCLVLALSSVSAIALRRRRGKMG